jgi:hypothetical protein
VFRYKLPPRPPKQPLNRIQTTNEGERLTGFVHGKEASDLEERFARALDGAGKEYIFEYEVLGPTTIPGQENQVDFLVEEVYPTEIDGEFTHKSAEQRAHDQLRDAVLNEYMSKDGWQPINRIGGHRLQTQEDADRVVQETYQ